MCAFAGIGVALATIVMPGWAQGAWIWAIVRSFLSLFADKQYEMFTHRVLCVKSLSLSLPLLPPPISLPQHTQSTDQWNQVPDHPPTGQYSDLFCVRRLRHSVRSSQYKPRAAGFWQDGSFVSRFSFLSLSI